MKTCAVVVVYNPTTKDINNIRNLSNLVDHLIVCDNSENSDAANLSFLEGSSIFSMNENLGIAKALNIGVAEAKKLGFKKVFLFDQDSEIDNNFIQGMLDFSVKHHAAVWAPNYTDINTGAQAKFVIFDFLFRKSIKCEGQNSVLTPVIVITSGCLIDIAAWETVGGFNDGYFIDHVDDEYCLKLKKFGYTVKVNCKITMKHAIGEGTRHSIFGFCIRTSNHTHIRRYYISRNYVAIIKEFWLPSLFVSYIAYLIKTILLILLFESQKMIKIRYLFIGMWHGIRGRMGKL